MILHRFFSDLFDRMLVKPGPPLVRLSASFYDPARDTTGFYVDLWIAPRPDLRRSFGELTPAGLRVTVGFERWPYSSPKPKPAPKFGVYNAPGGYLIWRAYSDAEEITTRIARNAGQIG